MVLLHLVAATGRHSTADAAPASAEAFAACEPSPGQPWTYDALMCVRQVGTAYGVRSEVIRRLRALGGGDSAHPWPTLVLAHVTLDQLDRARAIELYELAADGFAKGGEAEGEVIARQNLASQFRLRGDIDTAAAHVARVVAAAEASRQPLLIARAAVVEAVHSMATGGDIGRAHNVLLRADRLVDAAAPIGLRRTILFNLANASLYLGDVDAAVDALQRHRALRAEDGSPQNAATVEFNLLTARMMAAERRPGAVTRDELITTARAVLDEAVTLAEPLVQAQAHQVLGDLLAGTAPESAATHLEQCLDIERNLHFPSLRAGCLWSLSRDLALSDPDRATRASDEALSLLDAEHDRLLVAFAWQARLRLAWRTLPPGPAVSESMAALDAIERLRAAQSGENSRAGLFGNWTRNYQWLVGQLLQAQPSRLAQAFEVGERLRSRVLLERLLQAGASTGNAVTGEPDRTIQPRIAAVQRRLLSTTLTAVERGGLLQELRLLELEQEATRNDVGALPASAVPFASLASVRQALQSHEAVVWFSVAPWTDVYGDFGGGTWAITMTRDAATAHPLRPGDHLDAQVSAMVGLLRRRQSDPTLWAPAARRLGEALLGDAIADLPSDITSLIVVTDGPLHRVPFEVLSWRSGSMLGERFDITETPSATLWLQTRTHRAAARPDRVLVLADPAVPPGSPDGSVRLAALPGARREAAAIARLLRLEPDAVRQGAGASEPFVKSEALARFGIIHVAAHARADTTFPGRSAVFLSAGDGADDGWLQPAEIAALDLTGRLIVLSACESAEGALLSGEGPLSLARAFFAAGARAVVATRWPLRDDDAAFVMEWFYGALSEGDTVAAALGRARQQAIAAGLPAAAWAGVAALGDGMQRPFAGNAPQRVDGRIVGLVSALIFTGAFVAGWLLRRNS